MIRLRDLIGCTAADGLLLPSCGLDSDHGREVAIGSLETHLTRSHEPRTQEHNLRAMRSDSSRPSLKKSRARVEASALPSARKDKDSVLDAATLALVRKGLAESAAGKVVYRGSFKHYLTRQKRAP